MSDITFAASEKAFHPPFNALRKNFTFSNSNHKNLGAFTAGYSVSFHLENGKIDFQNDNTISISELDIKWDTLKASFGIDIPGFCVGGWCIVALPFVGCVVRFPKICIFNDNPDIGPTLDLSGLVTSEISFKAKPVVKYSVNPKRTSAMTDLDAEDASIPNEWQFFIDPEIVDIDVFEVSEAVGSLSGL